MIKSCMLSLALLMLFQPMLAQKRHDQDQYKYAIELYQQKAYKSARFEFNNYLKQFGNGNQTIEASYYMASSAVKAAQKDGESLMQKFVDRYPTHPLSKIAFVELGDFYYQKRKFEYADKYYSQAGELSLKQVFQAGYAQFRSDQKNKALNTFEKLKGSFSEYEYDAAYFQGFIHLENEKYDEADKYLKSAFESKPYKNPAMELYTSVLYQSKKYQELIDLVETELSGTKNAVVQNNLSDAYFALENYAKASGSYKQLLKQHSKRRNETNYFRAGYSFYHIDNKQEAIDQLKRAAVTDDSVGAYASYYLGVIYAEEGNLPFAEASFGNTAKYETVLKEDAVFFQGKVLSDDQKFTRCIDVLALYQKNYPNGKYSTEASELISKAYSMTNNYALAIHHIEALDRLTPDMKETYQRVSFLKGMQHFNDRQFATSIEVFQKSLVHSTNEETTQQTYYWIGEALTLEGKFKDAQFYYRSVSRSNEHLYLKAQYGLAYAYFNNREYDFALDTFKEFERQFDDQIKKQYLADALVRMGDCAFVLKDYQGGLDNYKKADRAGSTDKAHIYFQSGLLNRYLDNDIVAKSHFEKLIRELPESEKIDHAQFQIAQIDFEEGNFEVAIDEYTEFRAKYQTSALLPHVLLNQAVAFDNVGNSAESTANYKAILDRFPRHTVANSALVGLQDKYNNGDFTDFDSYLAKYKAANPNSEALENIEYENARSHFYNQKYDNAIAGFQQFIQSYPESSLTTNAIYFVGDSYFRKDELNKALGYFGDISDQTDFSKHSKVIYRLATIHSRLGEFDKGNKYFYQLAEVSKSFRDVMNLQQGMMENYYLLGLLDSTLHYGNELLGNPRVSVLAEANASLHIGKAEYGRGNLDLALQSFLPLVSNSPDERGAEAYYFISKIYDDKDEHDKALESLFVLVNNFNIYDEWVGKAYLLMSDIYIETDEIFQAKATLNSLIENSEIESIKKEAEDKLKTLDVEPQTEDSNE